MQPKAIQQVMFSNGNGAGYSQPNGWTTNNPIHRYAKPNSDFGRVSFEEKLKEAFKGEVIQSGNRFSDTIDDIIRENLKKMA